MKAKIINIVSIIVIVLSVLVIAAVALLSWKPFKQNGSGIVLPGTTSKINETVPGSTFDNFLFCGIDKTGKLTDVIMVVNFNNSTGKITILQIPRDTYVGGNIPTGKINAVYGHAPKNVSGMEYLKANIQKDFGIKIDHYAAITTKGFDNFVDSVGGVDLYVPINMNYSDPNQGLYIHLKKGYQHLSGSQAEQFVRFRKGWADGDLGRLQAQKSFLAALAAKLKKQSAVQLATKVLPTLMPPNFVSDMSVSQMIPLANSAKSMEMKNVVVYTAPGESYTDPDSGASYYTIHKSEVLTILNSAFVSGSRLTADDLQIKELSNKGKSSYSEGEDLENLQNTSSGSATSSQG